MIFEVLRVGVLEDLGLLFAVVDIVQSFMVGRAHSALCDQSWELLIIHNYLLEFYRLAIICSTDESLFTKI